MSQENKDVNIHNIAMDYRINTMPGDGVIEKVKNKKIKKEILGNKLTLEGIDEQIKKNQRDLRRLRNDNISLNNTTILNRQSFDSRSI